MLPANLQICDPIKKALEARDPPIPISVSSSSSGELRLSGSPLSENFKLPMYDRIFVILPVQDKGTIISHFF